MKNNNNPREKKRELQFLLVILLGIVFFSVNIVSATQLPVNLGTASDFTILSKAGISTTGTTSITGDIGVSPIDHTAITGFDLIGVPASDTFLTSALVTGKIYAANLVDPTPDKMTTAISDMELAYTNAQGRTTDSSPEDKTELGVGDISGMTLVPALYTWSTGLLINTGGSGDSNGVTLDCSGNPDGVFIFQIAQNLVVGNGAIITLNGCNADNIFWQVTGQATLGTTADFKGNILSATAIVLNTGATLNGRALAQTAVTLDANTVTLPVDISAPSCVSSQDIRVYNLQPDFNAIGGGGVYSAYYSPDNGYVAVSSGNTTLIDGREAGIIKAGLAIDPVDLIYEDEGLFAFKPTDTINEFSTKNLTYDVETQAGVNPVWMTIEIDTGVVGDRSDNTVYQFVPTTNPSGWHNVNASAGLWQKWNDNNGDVTGNPLITLSQVAIDNTGLDVVRTYLRLGMGDSYNNGGTGTIAWVDKATISGVTYDFVLNDTTAPVIILNGNSTITLDVGDNYTELGANVTDNVDTCLVVSINSSVNTSIVGTYTVFYDAVDSLGNVAQVTRTVNVVNPVIPNTQSSGRSSGGSHRRAVVANNTANECITNWVCGTWTACIDGKQTNVCLDSNNCSVIPKKFIMSQACTSQPTETQNNNGTNEPIPVVKKSNTTLKVIFILAGIALLTTAIVYLFSKKSPTP